MLKGAIGAITTCKIATWLIISVTAQQARIVVPPKSVDGALNRTINFTCTAVAQEIEWEVNGQPVDSALNSRGFDDSQKLIMLNETQNLRTRKLTVLASADNNNTNITCVAYFIVPVLSTTTSEPAVFLVFEPGLLESVSNLTVTSINSTTVLISWSPPFTLEGVPILGYNVTITNTTSGENETMLVEDTTLLYSIDHPDPENNFTVTVVPINEVGAGQPATSRPFLFSLIRIAVSETIQVKSSPTVPLKTTSSHTILTPSSTLLTADLSFFATTSNTVPLTRTTDLPALIPTLIPANVIISALIAVIVFTLITILGLVATIVCIVCSYEYKIRRRANKTPALQDLVQVRDNPAYQLVNLQRTADHNGSERVTTNEVSPQYENVEKEDEECECGKNIHNYENVQQ